LALLRPVRTLLLVHLLHYPAQVRSWASLEADLPTLPLGPTELRLAGELVDAYRRPLHWSDYVDDSVQALRALLRAKLQGQTPSEPELQPTLLPDLLNTLRQSVAARSADTSSGGLSRRRHGLSSRSSS
jgi:non-homologous end joining protein Ku